MIEQVFWLLYSLSWTQIDWALLLHIFGRVYMWVWWNKRKVCDSQVFTIEQNIVTLVLLILQSTWFGVIILHHDYQYAKKKKEEKNVRFLSHYDWTGCLDLEWNLSIPDGIIQLQQTAFVSLLPKMFTARWAMALKNHTRLIGFEPMTDLIHILKC